MANNSFNGAVMHAASRILQALFHQGPYSRTQISEFLNLDKATVSKITSRLLDKQMLLATGEGDISRKGGRRQIFLDLNPAHLEAAGIDISADNIYLRFYDLKGNYIEGKSKIFCGPFSRETAARLKTELQKNPLLAGCGLCSTGTVNLQGVPGIWLSPEACAFAVSRLQRTAFLDFQQTAPEKIKASLAINGQGVWTAPGEQDTFWEGPMDKFYSGTGFILKAGGVRRVFLYGLSEEAGIAAAKEISRHTDIDTSIVPLAAGNPVFTSGGAILFLEHFFSPRAGLLSAHLNPPARR